MTIGESHRRAVRGVRVMRAAVFRPCPGPRGESMEMGIILTECSRHPQGWPVGFGAWYWWAHLRPRCWVSEVEGWGWAWRLPAAAWLCLWGLRPIPAPHMWWPLLEPGRLQGQRGGVGRAGRRRWSRHFETLVLDRLCLYLQVLPLCAQLAPGWWQGHLSEADPVCALGKLRAWGRRIGGWEEGSSLRSQTGAEVARQAEWLGGGHGLGLTQGDS